MYNFEFGDMLFLGSYKSNPISEVSKPLKYSNYNFFIFHVGLYVGNNKVLDSSSLGIKVREITHFQEIYHLIVSKVKDPISDRNFLEEMINKYKQNTYGHFKGLDNKIISCSDLMYDLHAKYHKNKEYFIPTELSFKKKCGNFHEHWNDYKHLEGMPGTHPAKLIRDPKIKIEKIVLGRK